MKIEAVGQSLNQYFGEHRLFKILLPLDVAIVYGTAALGILFTFIDAGAFTTAVYYLGILGWLLAFSKSSYMVLAIGLGGEVISAGYHVVRSLIKYQSLNASSLLVACVFGYLAFMAYRKSISLGK